MKRSIWSILVVAAALMLSSCGQNGDENTNNGQFGIYSAFVTDRNNSIPLVSTNSQQGTMQLRLYNDGTYQVDGINNISPGRFGVNGQVLNLEGFGNAIPSNAQEAYANSNRSQAFQGNFNNGTQNYGACIQVNITSAAFYGNAFQGQNNTSGNRVFFCR